MKPMAVLLAVAMAATLTPSPLAAQDAAIGARVHGLIPMGDLRDLTDSQVGLGVAAYISIPLSRGLVLRPLVGAQFIPKGTTLGLTGTKTSIASVDLMVDALWFPDEDPEHGPRAEGREQQSEPAARAGLERALPRRRHGEGEPARQDR